MKNKLVAVLFIIVFLLLVAVICSLLTDGQDITNINDVRVNTGEEQTSTGVVKPLTTPTPTWETPTEPTVEPTLLPLPTVEPTPTPTPEPTPEPTPTAAPVGTVLGSGSFQSYSPVAGLNIVADWTAETVDDNTVAVKVTVSANSYSLHLDPARSLNIALGDQYVTLDVHALTYDGNTMAKNELAGTTFNVSLPVGASNSYTLAVEWHFGGAYMNTPIDVFECGGEIALVR